MSRLRPILLCMGLTLLLAASALAKQEVFLIRVEGAIGPATAGYIQRAIDESSERQGQCLIIQLDTPGGLLQSTKAIVQSLLASPIPTVVYVAPAGATAASAGCFIVVASDVAAMAPATSIGAAHPVEFGGGAAGGADDVMKKKLENYAASYIETIAARRHRNVAWAISSVRESASVSADKAKELGVIEIVAADMTDLLGQLDGRTVGGHCLETAGTRTIALPMTGREKALQMLGTPEAMFILMLIAVYGIIGELSSPGAILPGVAGVISLILLLYLWATVPVNLAGLALVVLALVLFIADVFAPSHGILTVGGIAAFFLGSMMMFNYADPMMRLSLWLIIPATLLTAAFFLLAIGAGLRAQLKPAQTGTQSMIGRTAIAITELGSRGGRVMIEGEYWDATCGAAVPAGGQVRIVSVNGLRLTVDPLPEETGHGRTSA